MASPQQRDDFALAGLVQGIGGTARHQDTSDDALLAGVLQQAKAAPNKGPVLASSLQRRQAQDDALLAGVMSTPATNLKRQDQHQHLRDDAALSGIISSTADQAKQDDAALFALQQGGPVDQQQRKDDAVLFGVLQQSTDLEQTSKRDDAVLSVLQQALVRDKLPDQKSRDDAALATMLGKDETTILSKSLKDDSLQRQDDAALDGFLGKAKSRSVAAGSFLPSRQKHGDDTALADIMKKASGGTHLTPQLKTHLVPLLIADSLNHYVLGWPRGEVGAKAAAGGNGKGNGLHQLFRPLGIAVDSSDAIFIADNGNRRVVKWPKDDWKGEVLASGWFDPLGVALVGSGAFLVTVSGGVELWQHGAAKGQVVASGKWPAGITIDFTDTGDPTLFFADMLNHCVYQLPSLATHGRIAAGGHGPGGHLQQLRRPFGLAVDCGGGAILVADSANHRVVRWTVSSQQGEVIAGGRGAGDRLDQLNCPRGVLVERSGDVLIADTLNHRVVRWRRGARRGEIIAGGAGQGYRRNQLDNPNSIAIDSSGGLLIADTGNHRVMRWAISG